MSLVLTLQWMVGWVLLWRIPRPAGERRSTDRPTIVVPARDEADNLARLLPSLAGEDVLVVDDGSTDGTADVARRFGAQVVDPGPLPADGWAGKPWACAAGARAATTGERLVFLDADVVLEPGGLDRILSAHDDLAPDGLLSVQPWHAVERPYEQLSAFPNLIGMAGTDAFTPLGRRLPPTGAFGPCLVVAKDVYDAAGGHAGPAVRAAVLDDAALARAVRTAGAPVVVLGGRGSIRFRMYPAGPRQLVEGWTKNLAGGAGGTRPLTLVLVIAWVGALLLGPWHPVLYAACAVQLLVLLRRIGTFSPLTAVLYPIPLAFFLAVFARSVFLTLVRRQVRWRGRDLRV